MYVSYICEPGYLLLLAKYTYVWEKKLHIKRNIKINMTNPVVLHLSQNLNFDLNFKSKFKKKQLY